MNAENEETKHKKSFLEECFEWVDTIINAVALLVIIFNIFIKLIIVSGVSMMPTLHDRDWLILNSLFYGLQKSDVVVINKVDTLNVPIIKRIIAVENDVVDIKDGNLYVNSELMNEKEYIGDSETPDYGNMSFPLTVPKDCYFVLGDNRENSVDSRFKEVGFVKKSEILGKAEFVVFPFNRFKVI